MSFMKKNAGFTLVELIVVIAILGILAGVAIPTYSGYIEKAQIAGDKQELHNVNLAFAAACAEAGESNFGRTDVSGGIQGGKFVYSAPFAESFGLYYPAADAGEFKVMTSVVYDPGTGAFVDNSDGTAQLKQYLNNSSYKGNLGTLTEQVDVLTGALSDYLKGNFTNLGGSGFAAYLTELGIASDDYDKQSEAAILYLAENAANMTENDVADAASTMTSLMQAILVEGDQKEIINQLTAKTGSELASYAAIYAVTEGIALQQGEGSDAWNALHGEDVDLTDANSVLNAMGNVLGSLSDDDAYELLYGKNNTSADMNAYFNALQAVNGQKDELEATVKEGGSIVNSTVIQDLIAQVGGE